MTTVFRGDGYVDVVWIVEHNITDSWLLAFSINWSDYSCPRYKDPRLRKCKIKVSRFHDLINQ